MHMSDLQLSLLVIGAVVVGGVYLYNRVQERRLRSRLQQAFGGTHDDVLLRTGAESAQAEGRLEPQFAPVEPARSEAVDAGPSSPVIADEAPAAVEFDSALDYVAEIEADAPFTEAALAELMSKIASCGKTARIAGLAPRSSTWEEIALGAGGRYSSLRLALQLVNRGGPVHAAQLAAFCDTVRHCAEKARARTSYPDPQAALKKARDIDAFCGKVDVAIGVNIVALGDACFTGTRIRAQAEAAGFKLESDGVFHFRNDQRQTLFTLDNHEPAPFLPEQIKSLSTSGITLLLDVPRVANGGEALERMLRIADSFAVALGGRLVDDNRAALSEAGISRIKDQVKSIQAAMAAQEVPAGSARALRLFS